MESPGKQHRHSLAAVVGFLHSFRHLVHWQPVHQPCALQLLAVNGDRLRDTLVVIGDACAVVDSAKILHEQVERTALGNVDIHVHMLSYPTELSYLPAVHVDSGKVGQSGDTHLSLQSPGGAEPINHIAVALVELLHGEQPVALNRFHLR